MGDLQTPKNPYLKSTSSSKFKKSGQILIESDYVQNATSPKRTYDEDDIELEYSITDRENPENTNQSYCNYPVEILVDDNLIN